MFEGIKFFLFLSRKNDFAQATELKTWQTKRSERYQKSRFHSRLRWQTILYPYQKLQITSANWKRLHSWIRNCFAEDSDKLVTLTAVSRRSSLTSMAMTCSLFERRGWKLDQVMFRKLCCSKLTNVALFIYEKKSCSESGTWKFRRWLNSHSKTFIQRSSAASSRQPHFYGIVQTISINRQLVCLPSPSRKLDIRKYINTLGCFINIKCLCGEEKRNHVRNK